MHAKSHNICLFLSDVFHLVQYPLGPPMFCKGRGFWIVVPPLSSCIMLDEVFIHSQCGLVTPSSKCLLHGVVRITKGKWTKKSMLLVIMHSANVRDYCPWESQFFFFFSYQKSLTVVLLPTPTTGILKAGSASSEDCLHLFPAFSNVKVVIPIGIIGRKYSYTEIAKHYNQGFSTPHLLLNIYQHISGPITSLISNPSHLPPSQKPQISMMLDL